MPAPAPARFLHVANGDCTTEKFGPAGLPGTSSVWADVLHEGPVPGGLTDDELVRIRADYLTQTLYGPSADEVVAQMNGWRNALTASSCDEIVLWYEHDLFDQLNLIQLLSWLGAARAAMSGRLISLICIGSFPGRPNFKGLGELTPDELASLFETRQPLSDAQIALAERAWQAFRASDPHAIEEFLNEDTSALPFLAAALARHLQEFPSTREGLSRTERRLLELCRSDAAADIWTTFERIADGETAFYIADGSFWQMARELADSSPPLLSIATESTAGELALPRGTFSVTATGRAVLDGELDRIQQCGLDRWLGGVHLQGAGPTWRWNQARGRIEFA